MAERRSGGIPVGGNLGAFLGQNTGENIAPLFRGAMQQPGGMLPTGAGIGGFLGSNMGQVGNMAGMKLAHGSHEPTVIIDGIPRYFTPGGHNPVDHNAPVDPSGNPIPQLKPRDEDIPLYGMPRTLSSTVFPIGNYVNKMVS